MTQLCLAEQRIRYGLTSEIEDHVEVIATARPAI
jgi:hypothetical protein